MKTLAHITMSLLVFLVVVMVAHATPVFAQTNVVRSSLSTKLADTSFEATVHEGFHFNLEAPNQLTIDGKGIKPEKSSKPREMKFTLPNAKFSDGRATLYVCDDALTSCRPFTVELQSKAKIRKEALPTSSLEVTPKAVTKNEFGFLEDNLEAAHG